MTASRPEIADGRRRSGTRRGVSAPAARAAESGKPRGEDTALRLRRSGIITRIVVFALAVYAVVTLINMRVKIEVAQQDQVAIQAQVDARTAANAQLQYDIDNKDSDAVKERIARDDLGLVGDGEQVFYDSGNVPASGAANIATGGGASASDSGASSAAPDTTGSGTSAP